MESKVERVNDLNSIDISHLVRESESQGYRFLKRLVGDYKDGTNTFDRPGEALFSICDKAGNVVAIGGVNQSPFSEGAQTARLQRFYVLDDARRKGVGSRLLKKNC